MIAFLMILLTYHHVAIVGQWQVEFCFCTGDATASKSKPDSIEDEGIARMLDYPSRNLTVACIYGLQYPNLWCVDANPSTKHQARGCPSSTPSHSYYCIHINTSVPCSLWLHMQCLTCTTAVTWVSEAIAFADGESHRLVR